MIFLDYHCIHIIRQVSIPKTFDSYEILIHEQKKKKTTPQKHDHFSIGYQNIKNIRGIGGKDYQLAGNRRLQSLRGLEFNMIGEEKLRDRDDFTNSSRYRRQGKISISPESELETGINESRDFAVVHRIRTNKH